MHRSGCAPTTDAERPGFVSPESAPKISLPETEAIQIIDSVQIWQLNCPPFCTDPGGSGNSPLQKQKSHGLTNCESRGLIILIQ